MQTEGTEVFESLQAELQRANRNVARFQDTGPLDRQMQSLLSQRGDALLKLAKHYLPDMSRPTIQSTFDGIRNDLLAILAQRDARHAKASGELEAGEQAIQDSNKKLDDVTRRLNEKVARREQLEAQVAGILKGNVDFQERSKLALQAEQKLHRNEQRVEEIAKEAAQKRPSYENSRLFMYLYDRAFGTPTYKYKGLTRSIDTWLSRMIDFPNARNGYDFLRTTPELVGNEVGRRRAQFTQLMQQVEAIQKAESDKIGLTAVLEEGEILGDERDALVLANDSLQKATQELRREIAELEQNENQFYKKAIERFRAFLGETRVAILKQRAVQTPEPDDDAIVKELAHLDEQMQDVNRQLAVLSEGRIDAQRFQQGLDRVIRNYRRANFDSQRSYFEDGFDGERVLGLFKNGKLEAEDVWKSIESAQRFRPNWAESTANGGIRVVNSSQGRVLLGAILEAASVAMHEAAYRGVQRRESSSFPFPMPGPPMSYPSAPSPPPYYPPPEPESEGGFTTGEGF